MIEEKISINRSGAVFGVIPSPLYSVLGIEVRGLGLDKMNDMISVTS